MTHCIDLSPELTPIRVTGTDAERFLQAQLTCDLGMLKAPAHLTSNGAASNRDTPSNEPTRALRAAWCNPKGRVITTLYAAVLNTDYLLIVPANLAETLLARFRLFVMRSDVTFSTDDNGWLAGRTSNADCDLGSEQLWFSLMGSQREFCLASREQCAPNDYCDTDLQQWRVHRIKDGEAYVDKETTETLLPEHLNLDLTDAVSFTKGCYPGQEVVARMHYKGKQKTRLFCGSADGEWSMDAGQPVIDKNNKTVGTVVESVTGDGELVATVTAPSSSLEESDGTVFFNDTNAAVGAESHELTLIKPSYWAE